MKVRYNRFYYKPLPEEVYIDESDIEGYGIFASQDLDAEVDLGSTHIKVPMIQDYIRTPLGGFLNHGDDPNCYLGITQEWDNYVVHNVFTSRKIKKDEELILNYEV